MSFSPKMPKTQMPPSSNAGISLPQSPKPVVPVSAAKPVQPPLAKQPSWADRMGTSIMRGEMKQGQQLQQQSSQGISKIMKESGEEKPLKPAMPKLQKSMAGSRGTGKPDKAVKVHNDYKIAKASTGKTTVPDSLLPPASPDPND